MSTAEDLRRIPDTKGKFLKIPLERVLEERIEEDAPRAAGFARGGAALRARGAQARRGRGPAGRLPPVRLTASYRQCGSLAPAQGGLELE